MPGFSGNAFTPYNAQSMHKNIYRQLANCLLKLRTVATPSNLRQASGFNNLTLVAVAAVILASLIVAWLVVGKIFQTEVKRVEIISSDQAESDEIYTTAENYQDMFQELGITLQPNDLVLPSPDAPVSNNGKIYLNRAQKYFVIDGEEMELHYSAYRFAHSIVSENGYVFGNQDNVYFLSEPTNDIETIVIDRHQEETESPAEEPRGSAKSEQIVRPGEVELELTLDQTDNSAEIQAEGFEWPNPIPNYLQDDLMTMAGIDRSEQVYAQKLITQESHWRYTVYNRQGSGAYGLPQSLPASKMASAGDDWRTNPVTQLIWMKSYVENRYGNFQNAYYQWSIRSPHWY